MSTHNVQHEAVLRGVYSKDEWRDVCRLVRPDWTEEDFDREWAEFQAMKKREQRRRALQ